MSRSYITGGVAERLAKYSQPEPNTGYLLWTAFAPPVPKQYGRVWDDRVHLFVGTRAENNEDMHRKGRYARAERNTASKLTMDLARSIRTDYASGESMRSIGVRHGVTHEAVRKIVRLETWKDG